MKEIRQLPTLVADIFDYLNKNTVYAVLRNSEGLPHCNRSRDIDVLIPRQQYNVLKGNLVDIINKSSFKVISFFESERICTFVCGRVSTTIDLVQFDFFFHTSVYGVILMDASEALETRVFDGNVYHVTKEYEFLDKFLYLKYLGEPYPDKYSELEKMMVGNSTIDNVIEKNFGVHNYSDLKKLSSSDFRTLINKRNKRCCYKKHLFNQLMFRYYFLKNKLYPKGYSIGFTGPDGVGKTTVIELLCKNLETVYSKVNLYHFRPLLIGNLSEVAHKAGIKKEVDRNYSQPHRGKKTNIISSLFRLSYYSIDYLVGYFKSVRKEIEKRQIVIFDRYFTDIICDSRRSRIHLPYKFLYAFGKCFIPSLDYNILLTASSETILARKKELDAAGIQAINERIDYLAKKRGYRKVLNEQTPEVAVAEILNYVFDSQHLKCLCRLK